LEGAPVVKRNTVHLSHLFIFFLSFPLSLFAHDAREELSDLTKPAVTVTLQSWDKLVGHAVLVGGKLIKTEAVKGPQTRKCRGKNIFAFSLENSTEESRETPLASIECIEDLQVQGDKLFIKSYREGKLVWLTLKNLTDRDQIPEEVLSVTFGPDSDSEIRTQGEALRIGRAGEKIIPQFIVGSETLSALSLLPASGDKPAVQWFDVFSPKGEPFFRRAISIPIEPGLLINNAVTLGDGQLVVAYQNVNARMGRIGRFAVDVKGAKVTASASYGTDVRMNPRWTLETANKISMVLPRVLAATEHGFIAADQTIWSWDDTPGNSLASVFYFSNADGKFHKLSGLQKSATYLTQVFMYDRGVLWIEDNKVLWTGSKSPFGSQFKTVAAAQ
jgi:hypothetical protein